jgi:hypothetical protein
MQGGGIFADKWMIRVATVPRSRSSWTHNHHEVDHQATDQETTCFAVLHVGNGWTNFCRLVVKQGSRLPSTQATGVCDRAILLVPMNYNDQLRELCARIKAAQDFEEVEKAGAELRKLLRQATEELEGGFAIPSATTSPMRMPPAE